MAPTLNPMGVGLKKSWASRCHVSRAAKSPIFDLHFGQGQAWSFQISFPCVHQRRLTQRAALNDRFMLTSHPKTPFFMFVVKSYIVGAE